MLDPTHVAISIKVAIGLAAGALAGFFAFIIELFQTGTFNLLQTVISVIGAGAFSLIVLALKERYDRRNQDRQQLTALQRTDAANSVERERILDHRVDSLFEELKSFYEVRDRERGQTIENLKALLSQSDSLCAQQRTLIAQQAATIQQLQSTGTK